MTINSDKPPAGIFFDKERQRWRVRLYKQRRVVHLTYHPSYQKALEQYQVAIKEREEYQPREKVPLPPTFIGLITGYRLNSQPISMQKILTES